MLIDLHAHSSGISQCCRIPAEEVLKAAMDVGLDGIVLTNHYQKVYITDGDAAGFAHRYAQEYYAAKKLGDEMGCRVFFGVEVTMSWQTSTHMLVYGVEPSFVERYPEMYDLTLEELYALVKENGGTLIEGHPFRKKDTVQDTRFLDGLEINCHPLYGKSFAGELTEIAERTGLILTCGGDYHADTYRAHCGTYIPDDIADSVALGKWLRETDEITLRIHEPGAETFRETTFIRTRRQNG